jgi:membrane protease YdiL (CAAX protease family)
VILAVARLRSPALFAVPVCCYAVVLTAAGGTAAYLLTGVALFAHAVVYLLPWRVPRDDRTPFGYWSETIACSVPLTLATAGWLLLAPHGARASLWAPRPSAAWFLVWTGVAGIAGLAMILCSGLDLRALRAGDLAFLAGPLPPYRAAARTWSVFVSVVSEEVIFRGVPAGIAHLRLAVMCAGAAAFVSGHHMVRGAEDLLRPRVVANEVGAAVALGGLVLASGSVWPAIIAHAVADLPHVALDFQRAGWVGYADSDQ